MKKDRMITIDNIFMMFLFIYAIILPIFITLNRIVVLFVGGMFGIEKIVYINVFKDDVSKKKYVLIFGFGIVLVILSILFMIIESIN